MPEAGDISARLVEVFAKIHAERMDGVPILNPRLAVETIGTRDWNGDWLSVLITPWFINLMLLPGTEERATTWAALTLGSSIPHRMPSGRFDFLVGEEPSLGRYQMCSLFSPVLEFEDQDAARLVAQAALEALFDADLDGEKRSEDKAGTQRGEEEPEVSASGISRRSLISGKIASGRRLA